MELRRNHSIDHTKLILYLRITRAFNQDYENEFNNRAYCV